MRITRKHLDAKANIINEIRGTVPRAWNVIGTVQIYSAYGAYSVHRVMNTSGGVDDLSGLGTARETSAFLSGMITALRMASDND